MPVKKPAKKTRSTSLPPEPPAVEHFVGRPWTDEDYSKRCERISSSIYDSFRLHGGLCLNNKLNLFLHQVGHQGKNFGDTNMVLAGQLPLPQKLEVEICEFEFLNQPFDHDRLRFLEIASFMFLVGNKPYARGLVRDLMRGSSLRHLRAPVTIGRGECFQFEISLNETLYLDTNGPGIHGRMILHGMLERSIC